MIQLDDLLALGGRLYGAATTHSFKDVSYDSRLTREGELFLALQTPRADGHDYIHSALEAGATGILCSWSPRNAGNATIILADNPPLLMQQWASQRLQTIAPTVVAIAGSIGKTSTKHVTANLLSTLAPTFASRQNFNSLLGLPIALARLQEDHHFAVLEFGTDRFGEIEQLAQLFAPHIGVITSINNVYLKSFGSREGVAEEQSKLVEALPANGWAILNGDDPYVLDLQEQTLAHRITFGQGENCHLQADAISLSLHETRFRLSWLGHPHIAQPPATVDIALPLIGEPAVINALAASAVALVCGMSLEDIAAHIAHVTYLNGRLRPHQLSSGATILDDTFDSACPTVATAIRTLAALPAKRRIIILGDTDPHSTNMPTDDQEIGTMAGSVADVLICKGDRGTSIVQAARQIQPDIHASVVYTASSALHALPKDIGKEDIILIKGSASSRMEHIVDGLLSSERDTTDILVRQEAAWHSVRIGTLNRPAFVRIDMDAVAHNIRRLREIAGVSLMVVVKGDAYGHGSVRIARVALANNASALAVATLSEARTLREADITAPILVLGYTPPWQAREAVLLDVCCAVFEQDVARAFSDAATELHRTATIHVKVDTGMGRLGMLPEEAGPFLYALTDMPNLRVEGLYSHFATADSADETFARIQLERFQTVVANITAAGLRPPRIHMANSAALLRFPQARFDMVRPGIACYGLSPSDETLLPSDFQSVLSFHTELAQVKSLPPGVSLSYGRTFVTQQDSLIATIPVGYADGFRRTPPWREVLVCGQRAPVVGRVCMDYALIDVTKIAGVKRGEPVVLIGKQRNNEITADEVANWLGTINYEVVSAILPRVPREVGEG